MPLSSPAPSATAPVGASPAQPELVPSSSSFHLFRQTPRTAATLWGSTADIRDSSHVVAVVGGGDETLLLSLCTHGSTPAKSSTAAAARHRRRSRRRRPLFRTSSHCSQLQLMYAAHSPFSTLFSSPVEPVLLPPSLPRSSDAAAPDRSFHGAAPSVGFPISPSSLDPRRTAPYAKLSPLSSLLLSIIMFDVWEVAT